MGFKGIAKLATPWGESFKTDDSTYPRHEFFPGSWDEYLMHSFQFRHRALARNSHGPDEFDVAPWSLFPEAYASRGRAKNLDQARETYGSGERVRREKKKNIVLCSRHLEDTDIHLPSAVDGTRNCHCRTSHLLSQNVTRRGL